MVAESEDAGPDEAGDAEQDAHGDHSHAAGDVHDHDAEGAHEHGDEAGHDHDTQGDSKEEAHDHGAEAGHDHGDEEGAHEHGDETGHDREAREQSEEAGQAHDGHDHEHGGERRVTAILIRTNDKRIRDAMELPNIINREEDAQAAMPAEEVTRLLEGIVGNIQAVLMVFAVMIVIVAGIGMMVSIYNSMSERRHEIAVMRALGARRSTVMAIILLESILLSLGGGVLGLVLGHGLIGLLQGRSWSTQGW